MKLSARLFLFITMFFLHFPLMAATVESGTLALKDYRQGDWNALLAKHAGKPFVVHFWGLTCGPCLEELPAWGEYMQKQQNLPLVTIQVDQVPQELIIQALTDSNLKSAEHLMLKDTFDEYMRTEVISGWMGELPFTLLIDPVGKVRKLRGKVNFDVVKKWQGAVE